MIKFVGDDVELDICDGADVSIIGSKVTITEAALPPPSRVIFVDPWLIRRLPRSL